MSVTTIVKEIAPPSLVGRQDVGEQMVVRVRVRFEAHIADGRPHQPDGEFEPRLHFWLSDGLSIVDWQEPSDDGIVTVSSVDLSPASPPVYVLIPLVVGNASKSAAALNARFNAGGALPLPGRGRALPRTPAPV